MLYLFIKADYRNMVLRQRLAKAVSVLARDLYLVKHLLGTELGQPCGVVLEQTWHESSMEYGLNREWKYYGGY